MTDTRQRYDRHRAWWEVPAVITFMVAIIGLLLAQDGFDLEIAGLMGLFLIGFSILNEITHRFANYVILRDDHFDVSKRSWGSKNRNKWTILYEDVASVRINEEKSEVVVTTQRKKGLLHRLGVDAETFRSG